MSDGSTGNDIHRILIADDEELSVWTLERIMRGEGFDQIRSTQDPHTVLELFDTFDPDLVLLDLHMPGLDGLAVMRQINGHTAGSFVPVIVISGDLAPEAKRRALSLGAADFIAKPFDAAEISLRVRNLLRLRDLTGKLEQRVAERTAKLKAAEIEVASRLSLAAEYRDYPDGAHVKRVGHIAAILAEQLLLPDEIVELIGYAAALHDIGKIAIPDSILLKPGPLTLEELDIMKSHTTIGARIVAGSSSPILGMAEEIARYHHENWDGTGYTPGLRGEDIPLAGRITAVADVFDALTHPRPYKKAWSVRDTVDWMDSMRARKFDPVVLDALHARIDSIVAETVNHTIEPGAIRLQIEDSTAA
jgi:response regulator RpfG family c-di-GMP phosphodiesterase